MYTPQRLEKACSLVQNAAKINYGLLERILKNNMDKQETLISTPPTLFDHENLRGPDSYC
jgi:hypothetical protein